MARVNLIFIVTQQPPSDYVYTQRREPNLCNALFAQGKCATAEGVTRAECDAIISVEGGSYGSLYRECSNFEINRLFEECPIKYISNYAFADCVNLTNLRGLGNVQTIGQYAFSGCTHLISVDTSATLRQLGNGAFRYCSQLSSVGSLETLTSVPASAFLLCESLGGVLLSENCTSIGYGAFSGCSNLSTLGDVTGVKKIGDSGFMNCTSLDVVEFDSLEEIGSGAFQNCPALSYVGDTSNWTTVKSNAFKNCTGLGDIAFPPYSQVTYHTTAFDGAVIQTAIVRCEDKTAYQTLLSNATVVAWSTDCKGIFLNWRMGVEENPTGENYKEYADESDYTFTVDENVNCLQIMYPSTLSIVHLYNTFLGDESEDLTETEYAKETTTEIDNVEYKVRQYLYPSTFFDNEFRIILA